MRDLAAAAIPGQDQTVVHVSGKRSCDRERVQMKTAACAAAFPDQLFICYICMLGLRFLYPCRILPSTIE